MTFVFPTLVGSEAQTKLPRSSSWKTLKSHWPGTLSLPQGGAVCKQRLRSRSGHERWLPERAAVQFWSSEVVPAAQVGSSSLAYRLPL